MLWYVLAATIGSSSLVILLKMFDLKGVNLYLGITINYIVGAVLSFLLAPIRIPLDEIGAGGLIPITLVAGAVFMLSFVVYGISAQRSGVAITTISGRAAVVVPVIFAFIVLGESVTPLKIGMLGLVLISMYLILRKSKSAPGVQTPKSNVWWVLLPVAVLLANGASDTMVAYANSLMPSRDYSPTVMGLIFVGGALTGAVCFLVSLIKRPHRPTVRDLLWGGLLGFMNWVCMIGVFKALGFMDTSVFYPIYYIGAIVISTVVGIFAFRERLSPINYVGIALAIIAIAVLSMQ